MLFKGLVLFWKNGLEYPLSKFGTWGDAIRCTLYIVIVYCPGMILAFIAYLIYPPKIVDVKGRLVRGR